MKALKSDCLFVVQVCQLLEAPTENETDTDQTELDKIELDTTEPDKFASRPQNIWHPPCVHALLLITSSTAKIGSISQVQLGSLIHACNSAGPHQLLDSMKNLYQLIVQMHACHVVHDNY